MCIFLSFRITLIQLQVSEVPSLGKSLGHTFFCSVDSDRFLWEIIYSLAWATQKSLLYISLVTHKGKQKMKNL